MFSSKTVAQVVKGFSKIILDLKKVAEYHQTIVDNGSDQLRAIQAQMEISAAESVRAQKIADRLQAILE